MLAGNLAVVMDFVVYKLEAVIDFVMSTLGVAVEQGLPGKPLESSAVAVIRQSDTPGK